MYTAEELGAALRALRHRENRKQSEVARSAGMTKAMLSSFETGKKLPSYPSLIQILIAMSADFHRLQETLAEVQRGPAGFMAAHLRQEHLGPALKLLRKRKALTQTAVARKAGLTKAMVSVYESGQILPSLRSLSLLLGALQADFHTLQEALDMIIEEGGRN